MDYKTHVIPRRKNVWNNDRIEAGNVGSVGDVNMLVRWKQSAPELDTRYDPQYYGPNEPMYGTSVSDGQSTSTFSGGGPASVTDDTFYGLRSFKHDYGIVFSDVRPQARFKDSKLSEIPNWPWNQKMAQVYNARHTGERFLPQLPAKPAEGAGPGAIPRGNAYPTTTNAMMNNPQQVPENMISSLSTTFSTRTPEQNLTQKLIALLGQAPRATATIPGRSAGIRGLG